MLKIFAHAFEILIVGHNVGGYIHLYAAGVGVIYRVGYFVVGKIARFHPHPKPLPTNINGVCTVCTRHLQFFKTAPGGKQLGPFHNSTSRALHTIFARKSNGKKSLPFDLKK
jgi:hypothetical protein